MCSRCNGAVVISQKGRHIIARCPVCPLTSIVLVLTSQAPEPDEESDLGEVERQLLDRVSEHARAIYLLIRLSNSENGFSPSVRELQTAMGWTSPNKAQHHLKQLAAVGLIERGYASARAIKLPHAA